MEHIQGSRDINPARRDPYRLQFSETEPGEERRRISPGYGRQERRRKKKAFHSGRRYKQGGFQPNLYVEPLEEEYYGEEEHEKEWERDVENYLLGKKRRLAGELSRGRRLRRISRIPVFKRERKRFFRERGFIPEYDIEYSEESYNPNEYTEQRYRPGFEGGFGYPRLGNYGHYGERAPEFESGFRGAESQSPYASGYQVGPSYEGEHGYGSTEDLGSSREPY